ncbi:MAG: hypothetical protein D6B27_00110 [Gammaproteobacteria bacterium]|nr:MAG: hypothetical protein D6B27_00110 [Gammaproteobacteria bacterium]
MNINLIISLKNICANTISEIGLIYSKLNNNETIKSLISILIISIIISLSLSSNFSKAQGSRRFAITNSKFSYKPLRKGRFLNHKKEAYEELVCNYAESIDSECAAISHPPCKKLVPIAFNYCRLEVYRQMHPQVTSRAEDLFWSRKFMYCVKSATKALVTNPDRQDKYCNNGDEEFFEENNNNSIEDDFFE